MFYALIINRLQTYEDEFYILNTCFLFFHIPVSRYVKTSFRLNIIYQFADNNIIRLVVFPKASAFLLSPYGRVDNIHPLRTGAGYGRLFYPDRHIPGFYHKYDLCRRGRRQGDRAGGGA